MHAGDHGHGDPVRCTTRLRRHSSCRRLRYRAQIEDSLRFHPSKARRNNFLLPFDVRPGVVPETFARCSLFDLPVSCLRHALDVAWSRARVRLLLRVRASSSASPLALGSRLPPTHFGLWQLPPFVIYTTHEPLPFPHREHPTLARAANASERQEGVTRLFLLTQVWVTALGGLPLPRGTIR